MQDVPALPVADAGEGTCDQPDYRLEGAVMTVAMGVCGWATVVGGGAGRYPVLDIAAGVVSVALIPFSLRYAAVPAALFLSALAAVSPAATPAASLAALVVARSRRLSVALAVGAAGIAAHLIRGAWRPIHGLPYGWWALLVCVAYAAVVGWGTLMRAHQALVSSLRERAVRAEADQARRVAEARAAERAMIAREMHDVLAHRLSLLATYAGALAYRPDAPPEQLARAAEVIRSGAHESLDELREVIGVLRDDTLPGLTADRVPLPGIARLPDLVEESRAAGMRVDVGGTAWPPGSTGRAADSTGLATAAASADVPDTVGRTVYRVVQEGLTNARKHAPGEPAGVTLGGGPGAGLDVCVVNPLGPGAAPASGRIPGSGTGLIGLAERVELAGGRLSFGAEDGVFRLRAWLPWPRPADADPADAGAPVTA